MNFQVKEGNYLKNKNNTKRIMTNYIIALVPLIIYSFYKNGILACQDNFNIYTLFKPLIIIILATITTFATEYFWYKIKTKNNDITHILKNTYSFIPGILLGLIIPINTPLLIVVFGSFMASFIGKLIYGGFGKNIFNPALIGRLFIIAAYSSIIIKNGGYLNAYEQTIDAISKATPLTNLSNLKYVGTYQNIVSPYGNLFNFIFGNIPGSLGETSAILCLVALIFLSYKKAIKWHISLYYIFTVFICTLIIGAFNGMGLWYPFFHILSGGLFFGAVFMATDPVTSPVTIFGQKIYGIFLGTLTVLLRFLTPYPEGVLTSILFLNLFIPFINQISINVRFNKSLKTIYYICIISLVLIISLIIALVVKKNSNIEEETTNLQVINQEIIADKTIYEVNHKGFMGPTSIHARITIENNQIIAIEILDTTDHYYDTMIKNTNYLDKLIKNQKNIDNVDAISGATYTSNYLKELTKEILKYHGEL